MTEALSALLNATMLRAAAGALALSTVSTVLGPLTAVGADEDTTPPVVQSLSVSPSSVDTSSGPQTVTVTAHITDDLVGITAQGGTSGALAIFRSPPSFVARPVAFYANQRISGAPQDGIYRSTLTLPQLAPQGTWRVTYLSMGDDLRNSTILDGAAAVDAAGLDASFEQAGPGDGEAPNADDVTLSPSSIDTSGSSRTVTVTARLTDSPAGISGFYGGLILGFVPPSGKRPNYAMLRQAQRISGSPFDGIYRAELVVPRYTEQGTWRVISATLADDIGGQQGNIRQITEPGALVAAGLDLSFEQTGVGDTTPPVVQSLTVSPAVVDTATRPQALIVVAHITDDLSGITEGRGLALSFAGPSRSPNSGWAYAPLTASARISGTPLDGIYQVVMTAPQASEDGTWSVVYAMLADAVGNSPSPSNSSLTPAEMGAVGVDVTFEVDNTGDPDVPTAVTGTPGDGQVALTWSAPTDDGGSPVTSYTVRVYAGLTPVKTVTATSTSTTVSGLTNGTAYIFTVAATNARGTGAPSAHSASLTPAASSNPIPPANLIAPVSPPAPVRSGYWMVGSDGSIYSFGDAPHLGNGPVGSAKAVDLEPTPSGNGYWVIDDQGHVFAFGDAKGKGNVERSRLTIGETVTSLSSTPTGSGYWAFTTKGRVLTFGDAQHFGDMSDKTLNGPVLDSIPTPSGQGYYMVASDGGIFAFGDARFAGSMGGQPLNAPVQSLVPDGDGTGYWLVASDGGVFAFDAGFRGSMGGKPLNRAVTGMVPFGNGYLMVGEDGGIFNFSDREFFGSLGANPPAHPITSVAVLDEA